MRVLRSGGRPAHRTLVHPPDGADGGEEEEDAAVADALADADPLGGRAGDLDRSLEASFEERARIVARGFLGIGEEEDEQSGVAGAGLPGELEEVARAPGGFAGVGTVGPGDGVLVGVLGDDLDLEPVGILGVGALPGGHGGEERRFPGFPVDELRDGVAEGGCGGGEEHEVAALAVAPEDSAGLSAGVGGLADDAESSEAEGIGEDGVEVYFLQGVDAVDGLLGLQGGLASAEALRRDLDEFDGVPHPR